MHQREAGRAAERETLWSDQFDVRRAEPLQTQDEIVTRLASALHVEIVQAETGRATAVSNLDAENLAMRCEAASYRSGAAAASTYDLCERALGVDPGNVRALTALRLATFARFAGSESELCRGFAAGPTASSTRALEMTTWILCSTLPESRCAGKNPSCAGCGYCRRALSGSESGLCGCV